MSKHLIVKITKIYKDKSGKDATKTRTVSIFADTEKYYMKKYSEKIYKPSEDDEREIMSVLERDGLKKEEVNNCSTMMNQLTKLLKNDFKLDNYGSVSITDGSDKSIIKSFDSKMTANDKFSIISYMVEWVDNYLHHGDFEKVVELAEKVYPAAKKMVNMFKRCI